MSSPEARPPGRRVLVVDDSADTVAMMKLLLKRAGFEVRTARDGPEALQTAVSFLPEVVLLDLTLPGMTGQEVAAELRANGELAGALIVAISGYGVQGAPPGFDHLMVKPVDHEELLRMIIGDDQGHESS